MTLARPDADPQRVQPSFPAQATVLPSVGFGKGDRLLFSVAQQDAAGLLPQIYSSDAGGDDLRLESTLSGDGLPPTGLRQSSDGGAFLGIRSGLVSVQRSSGDVSALTGGAEKPTSFDVR